MHLIVEPGIIIEMATCRVCSGKLCRNPALSLFTLLLMKNVELANADLVISTLTILLVAFFFADSVGESQLRSVPRPVNQYLGQNLLLTPAYWLLYWITLTFFFVNKLWVLF